MIQQIINAIKDAVLSYSPARSLIESMMKYDFKLGDTRTHLMQLCFSSLASWPLILILTAIYFDPFKYSWSLVKLFSEQNLFVLFLLDGHLSSMLIFFFAFFVLEWILRKEYFLLAIVFYFLNRSELHIHLAVIAVLATYFSRICYLWWLTVDVESESKKIWKAVSILQALAWLIVVVSSLNALDYLQSNHLFNEGSDLNRYSFLALIVLLYHVFSHLFLSLWGHFYFQKVVEPSNLPTYYSTSQWILRFNMSYYLQSLLKPQIAQQLEKHIERERQFVELKAQSPALAKFAVGAVLRKEIAFLKEANLRLTKI